jgi:heat shock protein HslJ
MFKTTGHTDRRYTAFPLVALITLVICACAPITPVPAAQEEGTQGEAAQATQVPEEEAGTPMLEGVNWRLLEYAGADGAPVAAEVEATMTLQDGQANGNAGCNSFFAAYTVDGQQLTFDQAGSTMMACAEPAMAQETTFLDHIGQAASYEIVEGRLHLLDAEGNPILTFEPQVAASLTGVLWQATFYNNGQQAVVDVLDGSAITALFSEDGQLSGSAGCNQYIAGYTVDGNQITIEPTAVTNMMCSEPDGLMEQEAAYLAALETAATYSIQGDTLEMRTAEDALVAMYTNAGPAAEAGTGASEVVTGTEIVTETATMTETGAVDAITGVTWQWVATEYSDDTTLTIDDPSRYTILLQPDGTAALQVDCNRGGGSYTLDGSLLSLDVVEMTRMACPEGSLAEVFIRELNSAATFVMDGEEFVINLAIDTGNMRFARAE